jgi:hypothetical protein
VYQDVLVGYQSFSPMSAHCGMTYTVHLLTVYIAVSNGGWCIISVCEDSDDGVRDERILKPRMQSREAERANGVKVVTIANTVYICWN